MAFKMDMSKVRKVAHDKKCATLEHKDGHKITIALEKLSPKMREELEKLPLHEAKSSKKMADGGQVADPDPKKAKEFAKGATASGWDPDRWVSNVKKAVSSEPNKMADGGNVADNAQPQQDSPQEPQQAAPQAPVTINIGQPQQASAPQPPQESFAHQAGSALRNHIGERVDALKTIGGAVAAPVGDFVGGLAGTPAPQAVSAPQQAPQMQPAMAQQAPPVVPGSQQQPPLAGSAPSMEDPYGTQATSDAYSKGLQQQEMGLQGEYLATKAQAAAEAQALQPQIAAQQEQAKKFQTHFDQLEKERQNFQQDVKDQHISPDNYWKDHSKLAAVIGLIIGGFNPTNQDSGVGDFLQSQINRNLDAQKAELGKKENLLSANLKQFGNLHDAQEMTRIMTNDIVANKLKLAAAQTAEPMAKARLLQKAGTLLSESSDRQGQLAARRTLLNGDSNQIAPERKVQFLVPEKERPEAYKQLAEAQEIAKVRDEVVSGFHEMSKLVPLTSRAGAPVQSKKQIEAYRSMIAGLSKRTAGKFTEADAGYLEKNLPAMGDDEKTTNVKLQRINALVNEKMNFPLLKNYGIDANKFGRFSDHGQPQFKTMPPVLPNKK